MYIHITCLQINKLAHKTMFFVLFEKKFKMTKFETSAVRGGKNFVPAGFG
jgi:hypothetical protein